MNSCIDVPKKRWAWQWKAMEQARFPHYQRNRSLFGKMLNDMYDVAVSNFTASFSFEGGVQRASFAMQREAPDIIESTYQTAYENTAIEFAQGWRANLKQEEEDEDIATLAALAVRDYFTALLFENAQKKRTLRQQIAEIVNTHVGIAQSVFAAQAASVLGLEPNQPIPTLDTNDINNIALAARKQFRNVITPRHSKMFTVTNTVAASNIGTLALARARERRTGQRMLKGWLSQRDSRVRDTHISADSNRIPLDELFVVGNSYLAFPGDWSHGAELKEIINCRCVLIYFSQ